MSEYQPAAAAAARPHPEVFITLADLAKVEAYTARACLGVCVAWGVIPSLFTGHFGSAILGGIFGFVIGSFIFLGVKKVVLEPRRRSNVKALANGLLASLRRGAAPITQDLSWSEGTPGALVITRHGEMALCDQSSEYDELWLRPDQIVSTSVERQATQITSTRHGGSFTFGGVSRGGLLGGYTTGGTSKSVTHTVETAFLEMHYQLETNGRTYTTVIPFGGNRRDAEALGAMIRRLVHVEPDMIARAERNGRIDAPG